MVRLQMISRGCLPVKFVVNLEAVYIQFSDSIFMTDNQFDTSIVIYSIRIYYNILLYYIILYYIILCYIILHYIMLCYVIYICHKPLLSQFLANFIQLLFACPNHQDRRLVSLYLKLTAKRDDQWTVDKAMILMVDNGLEHVFFPQYMGCHPKPIDELILIFFYDGYCTTNQ